MCICFSDILGGVPLELTTIWRQPVESLKEKISEYRKYRLIELMEDHGKFFKKLVVEEKNNLRECVSRMALGLSPPKGLMGMDRQIFDIVKNESNEDIITTLNPVARGALLEYHGQGLIRPLSLVAEIVFKSISFTNDIKGRVAELYILSRIEIEV